MGTYKNTVARLALNPLFRPIYARLISDRLILFMAHRFADPRRGAAGFSPETLRSLLMWLRERGIPVLSLRDAVDRILRGEPEFGVVFTVDDGYRDFSTVAAPVFREFRAPVTVFLATGFLDRDYWFWWDKITFGLSRTKVEHLRVERSGGPELLLTSQAHKAMAADRLVRWVKSVPEYQRPERVNNVLSGLAVHVPEDVPEEFEPMTWGDVRRLARSGVDFAPHSVSHPSMASLERGSVQREVRGSFDRLRAELHKDPIRVFCYPYGLKSDVSERTEYLVADAGMQAAVTALPGYAGHRAKDRPFALPRFSLPEDELDFRQIVTGLERFKQIVRPPWFGRHEDQA